MARHGILVLLTAAISFYLSGSFVAAAPPPPTSQAGGSGLADWAIVGHPKAAAEQIKDDDIPVLAASSEAYGRLAAESMLRRLNGTADIRWTGPDDRADRLPELFVTPRNGRPVTRRIEVVKRVFPHELSRRIGAYVKGTTDGNGTVVNLEVLYTRDRQWVDELTAFTLANLRVWSPAAAGQPLEFYGAVSVSEQRAFGYIVGGVYAPPDFRVSQSGEAASGSICPAGL